MKLSKVISSDVPMFFRCLEDCVPSCVHLRHLCQQRRVKKALHSCKLAKCLKKNMEIDLKTFFLFCYVINCISYLPHTIYYLFWIFETSFYCICFFFHTYPSILFFWLYQRTIAISFLLQWAVGRCCCYTSVYTSGALPLGNWGCGFPTTSGIQLVSGLPCAPMLTAPGFHAVCATWRIAAECGCLAWDRVW